MSSGGGSSGKVNYPGYMKELHRVALMGQNLDGDSGDIWGGDPYEPNNVYSIILDICEGTNPYSGEDAYDHSTDITTVQTRVTAINTLVDAIDHDQDWEDALDKAISSVDRPGVLLDDSTIDEATEVFRRETEWDHLRGVNRMAGMLSDIGSVYGSTFFWGMAMAEITREQAINGFRTKLKFEHNNKRLALISDSIDKTMALLHMKGQLLQLAAGTQLELSKANIVASVDQYAANLEYDEREALWKLEPWKALGNMLGSIAGTSIQDVRSDNKAKSAIAGGLTGAVGGALAMKGAAEAGFLGTKAAAATSLSAIPGIGLAIGAGALLGIGSAFL